MGIAKTKLYLTRVNPQDIELYLSADYKPIKTEDGRYLYNNEQPLGYDLWCPNVMEDLQYDEGTIPVKIIQSEKETGLWVACINDFFGDEQHMFAYKPKYQEKHPDRIDYSDEDADFGIHIRVEGLEMHAGEGPIPVTLVRI